MNSTIKDRLWLLVLGIVGAVVVLGLLSYIDFGRLRYFNAGLLTLGWGAWMADYIDNRAMLYRRQRRLRLAFSLLLFAGMYGSLNAALTDEGSPTSRVLLVSVAGGVLLASILFHPDDDLEIPEDRIYPWERWMKSFFSRSEK